MGLAKKYDQEEFIRRAKIKHNNKYNYSLVDYKNSRDKIIIVCPEHGKFIQIPYNHLQGKGCYMCANNKKYTISEFINRANLKHNNKFQYPDENYVNSITPIKIECPEHGIFKQTPGNHLSGVGCPKCSGNRRLTIDEFIDKANSRHNNLYTYPDKNYMSYDDKIQIMCNKHGLFKQAIRDHLSGRGCPICKNSKGEIMIQKILDDNHINYIRQYTFPDLKHKTYLKFDFAILSTNDKLKYLIEYNGEQHYRSIKKYHKYDVEIFNNSIYRDNLKIDYCKRNNIKLFIIKYNDNIEYELSQILSLY